MRGMPGMHQTSVPVTRAGGARSMKHSEGHSVMPMPLSQVYSLFNSLQSLVHCTAKGIERCLGQ